MLISSIPEHDESHKSNPNSNITDPSNIESDTELRNPELESDLDSNHTGADSSFDASTSTKTDFRNFQVKPHVEEFPWLYYNVLEMGY